MAEITRVQDFPAEARHAFDFRQDRIVEDARRRNHSAVAVDAFAALDLPQTIVARRDTINLDTVFDVEIPVRDPTDQVLMILLGGGENAPMHGKLAPGHVTVEARGIEPQGGIEAAPGGRQACGCVR